MPIYIKNSEDWEILDDVKELESGEAIDILDNKINVKFDDNTIKLNSEGELSTAAQAEFIYDLEATGNPEEDVKNIDYSIIKEHIDKGDNVSIHYLFGGVIYKFNLVETNYGNYAFSSLFSEGPISVSTILSVFEDSNRNVIDFFVDTTPITNLDKGLILTDTSEQNVFHNTKLGLKIDNSTIKFNDNDELSTVAPAEFVYELESTNNPKEDVKNINYDIIKEHIDKGDNVSIHYTLGRDLYKINHWETNSDDSYLFTGWASAGTAAVGVYLFISKNINWNNMNFYEYLPITRVDRGLTLTDTVEAGVFHLPKLGLKVDNYTIKFNEDDELIANIPDVSEPDNNTIKLNSDNKLEAQTMVGATSSTSGKKGIVPAPTVNDRNKFLKGDGTWTEASKGIWYYDLPFDGSEVSYNLIKEHYEKGELIILRFLPYEGTFGGDIYTLSYITPDKAVFSRSDPSVDEDGKYESNAIVSLEIHSDNTVKGYVSYDTPIYTYGTGLKVTKNPYSPYQLENELSVQEMTGATPAAAGTSGVVPAPAAGDEDKFLAGDGTWKSLHGDDDEWESPAENVSYTKVNGIVFISFTGAYVSIYTGSSGRICNIPAGYRPRYLITPTVTLFKVNSEPYNIALATMRSDGDLYVTAPALSGDYKVYGFISYPAYV